MAECVAALTHLYGVDTGIDGKALIRLSRMVQELSGIHMSPTKPVTGLNVFRHESGVHVDGMLKDPRSYEFLPASWVGRRAEYILGKHSGTALVRHLMNTSGFPCDAAMAQRILDEVKVAASQRDKSAHRRAFAMKEAFELLALSGIDPEPVLARHNVLKKWPGEQ
jgi:isopropylmalate/homocitrate/citramalate synthase